MPSRKSENRREGVEPLPYGFYRSWMDLVGADIIRPRILYAGRLEADPYGFYSSWIGDVGMGIAHPRTTNGRPYRFYSRLL